MPIKNSDLLKVTSLKVEDNLFSSLFGDVKSDIIAGFYLFILASLKFSLLLFDDTSRRLNILFYSKPCFSFGSKQDSKATTGILQALICFVKLLVDLIAFLHLGHIFNLDFFTIIALQ